MSLILNIDTALDTASVCLARDGDSLQLATNDNQKDHAAWLHTAINDIMKKAGYSISQLEAVAVSIGPGSYTGLRVGLASAKGFCYALNIPLIAVNTLEMMAVAVKEQATGLICPMIDARRMEVFTAIYNKDLREKSAPQSMLIDENSFASILSENQILFCGNGRKKLQTLISNGNAFFSDMASDATDLARLSQYYYNIKKFADLAYTEPLYLKEFYSPQRKD